MWVFISWESKRTLERGVERSRGVSVGLLVLRMRVFANWEGEKSGERKVS